MINIKSSRPLARDYEISVVIPVKNGAKTIDACLEAVLHQTLKPFEVIVVDGHSVDGTDKKTQNFPVTLTYEDYHTRSGACRVGIEHSTGQYIAFTDADCIPDKDWLLNLSKELNDGIVGVGGAIKNIGNGFWLDSVNLAYGTFLGICQFDTGRCS